MAENTLSFLWLIAVLLVPVVLVVRAFLAGGWLVARLEGRGPCPRVEPVWDAVATTAVAAAFARHAPRRNWLQRHAGIETWTMLSSAARFLRVRRRRRPGHRADRRPFGRRGMTELQR